MNSLKLDDHFFSKLRIVGIGLLFSLVLSVGYFIIFGLLHRDESGVYQAKKQQRSQKITQNLAVQSNSFGVRGQSKGVVNLSSKVLVDLIGNALISQQPIAVKTSEQLTKEAKKRGKQPSRYESTF